ncbi:hypothetical protein C9M44_10415 [Salmonella enterica subsp. enterica serovar Enteritidis]|nr:hypothetical protein [Salmonella enterica subsp. enterica serovar Enteritidis]
MPVRHQVKITGEKKMNKMLLAGSAGIVLLSAAASPVWADDNASTALKTDARTDVPQLRYF